MFPWVYGFQAGQVWRWWPSLVDRAVWAGIRLDIRVGRRVRGAREGYLLLAFADRGVLRALRGRDPARLRRAFDAVSVLADDTRVDESTSRTTIPLMTPMRCRCAWPTCLTSPASGSSSSPTVPS